MALPVERFFVLIDLVQQRQREQARDELAQASFIAWQMAQHQYAAMFQHAMFGVTDRKQIPKLKEIQTQFWKNFPTFGAYLKQMGVVKDD